MKDEPPVYSIGKENFELSDASLVGILDAEDGLFWAMDIYAKKKKVSSGVLEPKFSFTMLRHPEGTDRDLKALVWKGAEAYDKSLGDWIGDFYIYDAHFFQCDITMTRTGVSSFRMDCSGTVEISPAHVVRKKLIPFHIKADVVYAGIDCKHTDENTSRALLKNVCNVESYNWVERDGYNILVPQ